MRRRVAQGTLLLMLWLVLWGSLHPGAIAGGVVVAAVLLLMIGPAPGRRVFHFRPFRTGRYLLTLLWRLVQANALVAWEAVTPRGIHEAIVAVPVGALPEALMTLVANGVSLMPGTVTVDMDDHFLFVHVLHAEDIDEVREDLDRFVTLTVHTFGSDEDIAALESYRREGPRVSTPPGQRRGEGS